MVFQFQQAFFINVNAHKCFRNKNGILCVYPCGLLLKFKQEPDGLLRLHLGFKVYIVNLNSREALNLNMFQFWIHFN